MLFLLGHIVFTVALSTRSVSTKPRVPFMPAYFVLMVLFAIAATVYFTLGANFPVEMTVPVAVYICGISTAMWRALARMHAVNENGEQQSRIASLGDDLVHIIQK